MKLYLEGTDDLIDRLKDDGYGKSIIRVYRYEQLKDDMVNISMDIDGPDLNYVKLIYGDYILDLI